MMKKWLAKCLLVLIGIIPIIGEAKEMEYVSYSSIIDVKKNRTFQVRESYSIYFIENTNEINRKLNERMPIKRKDKSEQVVIGKIDQIQVQDKQFSVEKEDVYQNIQIQTNGTKDEVLEYELSYIYNLGKDIMPKYDEFYYNIVSDIDASISSLFFMVTLPDKFDQNKIEFSIDGKYNLSKDDITYTIDGNTITGYLNKLLEPNQTFSIRIELPNHYFVGATDNFNDMLFLLLILPIIGGIMVFIFWILYGKGNKIKPSKNIEPPFRFDPAEIGYIFKGKAEEMDLVSDLIYLANEGYLRFEENDDGYKLGTENTFRIVKLKDYDKKNAVQKILFDNLFGEQEVVEMVNIEYQFADHLMDAKKTLDNLDNKKKMFFNNIHTLRGISLILIAISVILINFNFIHAFTKNYWLVPVLSMIMFFGIVILFLVDTKLLIKIIFGVGMIGFCIYFAISNIFVQQKALIIYVIGLLLIGIMIFFYKRLKERTKYGNQLLGEVYGFQETLCSMSNVELKDVLETNPNYFYDMCPYTFVLGVFDLWIQKGEEIVLEKPDWYITTEEFKLQKFSKFMKNVLYTVTKAMIMRNYSGGVHIEYKQEKLQTNLND